jgi:hypothetical protein
MEHEDKGYFVNLGGIPVDLNAGMIEAVTNPPSEFVSKHRYVETNPCPSANGHRPAGRG